MTVQLRLRNSLVQRCGGLLVALAAVGLLTATVRTAPEPSAVPQRWQLDFDAGPLRLYLDEQTGNAYWFFTYTVTNKTGDTRLWAPEFTLFTDAGEILESGRNIPPRITTGLMTLLDNPLLETQNYIIGDILEGKEHAKSGIVIWRAKSTDVNELSLFIAEIGRAHV